MEQSRKTMRYTEKQIDYIKHPPMPREERAKQFLPFAALKEYPDALRREEERFAADPENYGDAVYGAADPMEDLMEDFMEDLADREAADGAYHGVADPVEDPADFPDAFDEDPVKDFEETE